MQPLSGVTPNARVYASCTVALISKPVINSEMMLMLNAVFRPELAVLNVSSTVCAVLSVR